jgi:hypothetical protein
LPLLLKLRRYKNVITTLSVLSVFLLGVSVLYGHPVKAHRIAYRTQLGLDLDGDRLPETATIKESDHLYQVSIHFTTGRPKVRIKTYITEGVAGLSFQTTDVNNDNKRDIVIVSATSNRPVAVWLNQGKAKFKRVQPWFCGGVGRYTGPIYRFRATSQPEPVGYVSIDPLSQITPEVKDFRLDHEVIALLFSQPDQRPFDSLLRQKPPRGPPATTRI